MSCAPGDELELRGPVGGYFVWEESPPGPVLLVAGGSGVVPLRAMLRHRLATRSSVPVRLLYSARSLDAIIYHDELMGFAGDDGVDLRLALTRDWPGGWQGYRGRIDQELIDDVAWPAAEAPLTFICGPSGFVEAVAAALVAGGQPPDTIRTERFGPTG